MIKTKILENTKENIEFELSIDNKNNFFVECYLISEDEGDTYAIHIYDTIHSDINPYNENEIMYGWFDSDGGTFDGFSIEIDLEEGNNEKLCNIIEENVLNILFNDKNGLVNEHWRKI